MQAFNCVFASHYFDEKRVCRACGRKFIFFAEEQKHWYEELGYSLDADCVECVPCRKANQGHRRLQRKYEEICAKEVRTDQETLDMAETGLELMDAGMFGPQGLDRVRMWLNRCSASGKESERFLAVKARFAVVADEPAAH